MPGLIVVNSWADRAKLAAIHALGMQVVLLDWSDFREVEALMTHAIRHLGLFAFVNFQNPWRHDGYKTYAYENWLDLCRRVPGSSDPSDRGVAEASSDRAKDIGSWFR
jgi:threonine synthase